MSNSKGVPERKAYSIPLRSAEVFRISASANIFDPHQLTSQNPP
jgi:hypothetical protein